MKKTIIAVFSLTFLFAAKTHSQSSKEKADAIAAEFNKEKNKEKEKNGVVTQKHKVVETKTDVRDNTASYAGKYELDGFGHYIVFRNGQNNTWEADYMLLQDGKEIIKAVLKDIKIESALLTATIQYDDGRNLPFEGAFINRYVNGEKTTGFGIPHLPELSNEFALDKVFFKRIE